MNNFDRPYATPMTETRPPQEPAAILTPAKKSIGAKIMNWWHSLACPPEPPGDATVAQREKHRRARSVSSVVFFFLILMVIGIPTTLTLPDPRIFWICCSILVALIIAPFFNRAGQVVVAGMFVLLSVQGTIMAETLIMPVLNETALQLYDILMLVILLSLVIMPASVTWGLAIFDCIFVTLHLLFHETLFHQSALPAFDALIKSEGVITLLLRPVILILFLTSVSTFLLSSVAKAVRQSYEAEFVANLEHAAAQQNEVEAEEKRVLEESIQQIVQAHTDTMNGQLRERIPYPQAKILWPLVGVMNTLWARLLRSQQREQELAQIQQDISTYNEILQRSIQSPQRPLAPYRTKTALSPLTVAMARLHQAVLNISSRPSPNKTDRTSLY